VIGAGGVPAARLTKGKGALVGLGPDHRDTVTTRAILVSGVRMLIEKGGQ
jgi:hypothetical protein